MRFSFTIVAILGVLMLMISCGGAPHHQSTSSDDTKLTTAPTTALHISLPLESGSSVDTIHLGRMREGEIVKSNFTLSNNSNQPLVIIDIRVACGCARANYDTKPVMVGEQRVVDFTFNSSGRAGFQQKYFDIQFAKGESLKVHFDAEVQ